MAKGPAIRDISTLIQAGIDPRTGLPIKAKGAIDEGCDLKESIKKILRVIDEQDAVNRYRWYNLPCNITSQELERMLYYKGQLAFFYFDDLDEFYFMPYALAGSIDFYGRYNYVHPIPMSAGVDEDSDTYKNQSELLSKLKLKCRYGVVAYEDEINIDTLTRSCVLLHDYTKQTAQNIISRQILNDDLIDVIADCIPFMRTALINATGIDGVRVNDADQESAIRTASKTIYKSALKGEIWTPIVGTVEFQELTNQATGKASEFMLAMQSLDNLRLSTYGLENGGLFEKKAHELAAEAAMNQVNVGLVLQDGLSIRQNFCNIVNSIWGLNIWCQISENESMDLNGDGVSYDQDNNITPTERDEGGEEDESNL